MEVAEIRLLKRIEKASRELYTKLDDSEYSIGKMSMLAHAHGMPYEVNYRSAQKKLRKLLLEYEDMFYK
jgi:hypothetical protein